MKYNNVDNYIEVLSNWNDWRSYFSETVKKYYEYGKEQKCDKNNLLKSPEQYCFFIFPQSQSEWKIGTITIFYIQMFL
ncbi:uncharacterized protein LOC132921099 isoform X2 [Rhopalosiphum padi]|uniref:uncharacterized protein LOC132921099 isoform X2 n=1 Tax=Rhopalosiphum padi TaxID=40932 RepID=UPI00298E82A7|nr:uncharacterized protein LOC132921099 isoform X2 [Rhopalosiphum padi]